MTERLALAPYLEVCKKDYFGDMSPKMSFQIEKKIFRTIFYGHNTSLAKYETKNGSPVYFTRAIRNFRPFYSHQIFHLNPDGSKKIPTELKKYFFAKENISELISFLNSSIPMLFFYWYTDVRNVNTGFVRLLLLPESIIGDNNMKSFEKYLMKDFESNKEKRFNKTTGCVESYYYPAKSKHIINRIDAEFAAHYGFSEEELDFIINYDIKYRMGDELITDAE